MQRGPDTSRHAHPLPSPPPSWSTRAVAGINVIKFPVKSCSTRLLWAIFPIKGLQKPLPVSSPHPMVEAHWLFHRTGFLRWESRLIPVSYMGIFPHVTLV